MFPQNAIVWKAKTIVPINSVNGTFAFGFNFNGRPESNNHGECMILLKNITAPNPYGYQIRDFPNMANQFDQMRCSGASFKWMPKWPPGSQEGFDYNPVYCVTDMDGIESPFSQWDPDTFIQQMGGISTRNFGRPFKIYRKAVKTRINTRIPTVYPSNKSFIADPDVPIEQRIMPNVNLAGRWLPLIPVGGAASSIPFIVDKFESDVQRGCHFGMVGTTNINSEEAVLIGYMIVTTYHTLKDRR